MSKKPTVLFRANGAIDKIVNIHLSKAYILILAILQDRQARGLITVRDPRALAEEMVREIEGNSQTIVTLSI